MKHILSALALFMVLAASSTKARANAGDQTGNTLVNACIDGDKGEKHWEGFCTGFIIGVFSTLGDICHPDTVTVEQVVKIARKYLDDHPETLNLPAHILVHRSMTKAFPCPK